jgi:hypothetical protein
MAGTRETPEPDLERDPQEMVKSEKRKGATERGMEDGGGCLPVSATGEGL